MPNTTPNLGLFKYDLSSDGKQPFNITQSLNDNWDSLDNGYAFLNNKINEIYNTLDLCKLFTGTILYYSGESIPEGYLLCDGSAVSRTLYSKLFDIIGVTYGAGNNATTFNIPNLIDIFIEGDTVVGKSKIAGLPNITGDLCSSTVSNFSNNTGWSGATANKTGAVQDYGYPNNRNKFAQLNGANYTTMEVRRGNIDASRSSSIYGNSSTVQPPALTMLPIIKY